MLCFLKDGPQSTCGARFGYLLPLGKRKTDFKKTADPDAWNRGRHKPVFSVWLDAGAPLSWFLL